MTESVENLIKKRLTSEISKELYNKLINIWDDNNFILGVMSRTETDEQKQKMIEIINSGLTDTDEILLNAMAIEENLDILTIKEKYEIDW